MEQTVNVIALVKNKERYIFIYDDESTAEVYRALGKFACDKELSLNWYDAAVLSQKIRKLAKEE